MNRVMAFAVTGGVWLALVGAVGALLALLGYRLGVWDARFALLTLVPWATTASVAAFVLCLLAVMGVQDEAKGEALILLAAVDVDLASMREKLREAGVPNLWIPKKVSRVDSIPVLASGKLDLKKCQELTTQTKPDAE